MTSALKEPEKTDWTALRHAFAETAHYKPYNFKWKEELAKVGKDIERGELMVAELALVKLLDRERFIRLDAQALAVALYDKMGRKDET